jgi:hypothetical protein
MISAGLLSRRSGQIAARLGRDNSSLIWLGCVDCRSRICGVRCGLGIGVNANQIKGKSHHENRDDAFNNIEMKDANSLHVQARQLTHVRPACKIYMQPSCI